MAFIPALPDGRPPVPGFDYLAHFAAVWGTDITKGLAARRFERDYPRLRAERLLKHLPGLHNQKSHGNQFAKTPWLFDAIVPNLGPAFPDPHKWSAHVTSYARDPKYRADFDTWYEKKAGKKYLPWSPLDEVLPPPVPSAKPPGSNAPEPPPKVPTAPEPVIALMNQADWKGTLAQGPDQGVVEMWTDAGPVSVSGTFEYDFDNNVVRVTDATVDPEGPGGFPVKGTMNVEFGKNGKPSAAYLYPATEDPFADMVTYSKPQFGWWKALEDIPLGVPEPGTVETVTVDPEPEPEGVDSAAIGDAWGAADPIPGHTTGYIYATTKGKGTDKYPVLLPAETVSWDDSPGGGPTLHYKPAFSGYGTGITLKITPNGVTYAKGFADPPEKVGFSIIDGTFPEISAEVLPGAAPDDAKPTDPTVDWSDDTKAKYGLDQTGPGQLVAVGGVTEHKKVPFTVHLPPEVAVDWDGAVTLTYTQTEPGYKDNKFVVATSANGMYLSSKFGNPVEHPDTMSALDEVTVEVAAPKPLSALTFTEVANHFDAYKPVSLTFNLKEGDSTNLGGPYVFDTSNAKAKYNDNQTTVIGPVTFTSGSMINADPVTQTITGELHVNADGTTNFYPDNPDASSLLFNPLWAGEWSQTVTGTPEEESSGNEVLDAASGDAPDGLVFTLTDNTTNKVTKVVVPQPAAGNPEMLGVSPAGKGHPEKGTVAFTFSDAIDPKDGVAKKFRVYTHNGKISSVTMYGDGPDGDLVQWHESNDKGYSFTVKPATPAPSAAFHLNYNNGQWDVYVPNDSAQSPTGVWSGNLFVAEYKGAMVEGVKGTLTLSFDKGGLATGEFTPDDPNNLGVPHFSWIGHDLATIDTKPPPTPPAQAGLGTLSLSFPKGTADLKVVKEPLPVGDKTQYTVISGTWLNGDDAAGDTLFVNDSDLTVNVHYQTGDDPDHFEMQGYNFKPEGPAPVEAVYEVHPTGETFDLPKSWESIKHFQPGDYVEFKTQYSPPIRGIYLGVDKVITKNGKSGPRMRFYAVSPDGKHQSGYVHLSPAHMTSYLNLTATVLAHGDTPPKPKQTLKVPKSMSVADRRAAFAPYSGYPIQVTTNDGEVVEGVFTIITKSKPAAMIFYQQFGSTSQHLPLSSIKQVDVADWDHWYATGQDYFDGVAQPKGPSEPVVTSGEVPAEYLPFVTAGEAVTVEKPPAPTPAPTPTPPPTPKPADVPLPTAAPGLVVGAPISAEKPSGPDVGAAGLPPGFGGEAPTQPTPEPSPEPAAPVAGSVQEKAKAAFLSGSEVDITFDGKHFIGTITSIGPDSNGEPVVALTYTNPKLPEVPTGYLHLNGIDTIEYTGGGNPQEVPYPQHLLGGDNGMGEGTLFVKPKEGSPFSLNTKAGSGFLNEDGTYTMVYSLPAGGEVEVKVDASGPTMFQTSDGVWLPVETVTFDSATTNTPVPEKVKFYAGAGTLNVTYPSGVNGDIHVKDPSEPYISGSTGNWQIGYATKESGKKVTLELDKESGIPLSFQSGDGIWHELVGETPFTPDQTQPLKPDPSKPVYAATGPGDTVEVLGGISGVYALKPGRRYSRNGRMVVYVGPVPKKYGDSEWSAAVYHLEGPNKGQVITGSPKGMWTMIDGNDHSAEVDQEPYPLIMKKSIPVKTRREFVNEFDGYRVTVTTYNGDTYTGYGIPRPYAKPASFALFGGEPGDGQKGMTADVPLSTIEQINVVDTLWWPSPHAYADPDKGPKKKSDLPMDGLEKVPAEWQPYFQGFEQNLDVHDALFDALNSNTPVLLTLDNGKVLDGTVASIGDHPSGKKQVMFEYAVPVKSIGGTVPHAFFFVDQVTAVQPKPADTQDVDPSIPHTALMTQKDDQVLVVTLTGGDKVQGKVQSVGDAGLTLVDGNSEKYYTWGDIEFVASTPTWLGQYPKLVPEGEYPLSHEPDGPDFGGSAQALGFQASTGGHLKITDQLGGENILPVGRPVYHTGSNGQAYLEYLLLDHPGGMVKVWLDKSTGTPQWTSSTEGYLDGLQNVSATWNPSSGAIFTLEKGPPRYKPGGIGHHISGPTAVNPATGNKKPAWALLTPGLEYNVISDKPDAPLAVVYVAAHPTDGWGWVKSIKGPGKGGIVPMDLTTVDFEQRTAKPSWKKIETAPEDIKFGMAVPTTKRVARLRPASHREVALYTHDGEGFSGYLGEPYLKGKKMVVDVTLGTGATKTVPVKNVAAVDIKSSTMWLSSDHFLNEGGTAPSTFPTKFAEQHFAAKGDGPGVYAPYFGMTPKSEEPMAPSILTVDEMKVKEQIAAAKIDGTKVTVDTHEGSVYQGYITVAGPNNFTIDTDSGGIGLAYSEVLPPIGLASDKHAEVKADAMNAYMKGYEITFNKNSSLGPEWYGYVADITTEGFLLQWVMPGSSQQDQEVIPWSKAYNLKPSMTLHYGHTPDDPGHLIGNVPGTGEQAKKQIANAPQGVPITVTTKGGFAYKGAVQQPPGDTGFHLLDPDTMNVIAALDYTNVDTVAYADPTPKPADTPPAPTTPTVPAPDGTQKYTPTDHDPYADPNVPYILPGGMVDRWDSSWSAKPYKPKGKGSNPGGFYTDAAGKKWYIKVGMKKSYSEPYEYDNRSKNEVIARDLYAAAGVGVPEVQLVDVRLRKDELPNGSSSPAHLGVKSAIVGGGAPIQSLESALSADKKGTIAKVRHGFAVDAWLGNWDTAGTESDNIVFVDGEPYRIDVGGTMLYRAQGGLKGDEFTYNVDELDSMRGKGSKGGQALASTKALFGEMTEPEMRESFSSTVANLTDDQIDGIVDSYALSESEAEMLKEKLKKRRLDMAEKLGIDLVDHPEFNFQFAYENKHLGELGFASVPEYEEATAWFGSKDAVDKVHAGMAFDTTGLKSVAAAMDLAKETGVHDPDEFVRVARSIHIVTEGNGYTLGEVMGRNESMDWTWPHFADVVDEMLTGPLAEKWSPVGYLPEEKWAEKDQIPQRPKNPWQFDRWRTEKYRPDDDSDEAKAFRAGWDAWVAQLTASHKAGVVKQVTGLIDSSAFPTTTDAPYKPTRADVDANNWFRAHRARTAQAFHKMPTGGGVTASQIAAWATQAWQSGTLQASTIQDWAHAWGGTVEHASLFGLQWGALERSGFDLSTVKEDGEDNTNDQQYFLIYHPGEGEWIRLSFANAMFKHLNTYLSSKTNREKYLAALAGWEVGAAHAWKKQGLDEVAVLRGIRVPKKIATDVMGLHRYTASEVASLGDLVWTPVDEKIPQRGVGSFTVNTGIAASGGVTGSGDTVLVFRAVFKADHMMGAKGHPFPSMSGGGEGEVMMPAGIGYEVIAFDKNSVDYDTIKKYLGEGVKYVG